MPQQSSSSGSGGLALLTSSEFVLDFSAVAQPEGFLTALRQSTAEAMSVSLEKLTFELLFEAPSSSSGSGSRPWPSVRCRGLLAEGAVWDSSAKALTLSDDLATPLPDVWCVWAPRSAEGGSGSGSDSSDATLSVPTYLTSARQRLLFRASLAVDAAVEEWQWRLRSVALIASTLA